MFLRRFLAILLHSFGFLQGIVVKYSEVSKKHTATIFRVTNRLDVAAIWKNNFIGVCPKENIGGKRG